MVKRWRTIDGVDDVKVWHGATLVFRSSHSADGRRHGLARYYNEDGSFQRSTLWVDGTERPDLIKNKLAQVIIFGKCLIQE